MSYLFKNFILLILYYIQMNNSYKFSHLSDDYELNFYSS